MFGNRKNDIDQENETQDTRKSKKDADRLLLGISIRSALAILSLWLLAPFLRGGGGLEMNFVFVIIAGQWLLVIPATLVDFYVYRGLSHRRQLYKIHHLVRVGLPLLLNILAASSFFILVIF
jgi:sterol desaturase/sphingolipid hydroxylase (fatty acid hydroxylase superfamily)